MASRVVSTRSCSAEAVRGDGESRSTAPAPRVIHARVCAHCGVTYPQLRLYFAFRAGLYGTLGGANIERPDRPTGDAPARVIRRTAPQRAGGRSAVSRVR